MLQRVVWNTKSHRKKQTPDLCSVLNMLSCLFVNVLAVHLNVLQTELHCYSWYLFDIKCVPKL